MSFRYLGTPLIEQQKPQARYDQGKQRFNGAFTDGFSAGYNYSVGSKEGFQPSTYIAGKQSTAYDYMDDEDMNEFGAKKLMMEEFESLGSTEREVQRKKLQAKGLSSFNDLIVFESQLGRNLYNNLKMALIKSNKKPKILASNPVLELSLSTGATNTYGRGYRLALNPKPEKEQQLSEKRKFGTIYDDEYEIYDSPAYNFETTIVDTEENFSSKINNRSKNEVIPGFKESRVAAELPKVYLTPMPPRDYIPKPTFEQDLGEKRTIAKSVLSYMSSQNAKRLKSFANRAISISTPEQANEPIAIYSVPLKIAEDALQGFMPFGDDLEKQKRYKAFLQDIIDKTKHAIETDSKSPERKISDAEAIETREFSKAAMLYRPLSDMISQRFTSESNSPIPTQQKKSKLFGKETRKISKWQPSQVLCRRFAVRYIEDIDVEHEEKKDIEPLNAETMATLMKERDILMLGGENAVMKDVVESEVLTKDDMLTELHAGLDLMGQQVNAIKEKPSMDLFKAIFAESEESDENEIEIPHKSSAEIEPSSLNPKNLMKPDSNELKLEKATKSTEKIHIGAKSNQNFNFSSKKSEEFKPMFVKPTKGTDKPGNVRARKKQKALISFDDEEVSQEIPPSAKSAKRVRTSAIDFM